MVEKLVFAGLCWLALSSPVAAGEFQRAAPVHVDHDGEKWAQKTLKKLSLEEKVGQMFMVRLAMPQFVNIKNPDYLKWLDQIDATIWVLSCSPCLRMAHHFPRASRMKRPC